MKLDPELRILVVDDMPAMRSILRGMLQDMGLTQIADAEDGEIAWEMLRVGAGSGSTVPYDLMIADWNMPGMSGVDLLRAVRSFPATRELPVLVITAQVEDTRLTEARHSGATDYLTKPFGPAELQAKIEAIFKG